VMPMIGRPIKSSCSLRYPREAPAKEHPPLRALNVILPDKSGFCVAME
jgi:hypothetical protein